jgi:microcystin-dependent protein
MNPYVAEIAMFGGNFAPVNWALCDGQTLAISQNTALFSLLGTTYGGNGTSNFQLPNMQGNAPMFWQQGLGLTNYSVGQTAGVDSVTLLLTEIPFHNHAVVTATAQMASDKQSIPSAAVVLGNSGPGKAYSDAPGTLIQFHPNAILSAGGNFPHGNQQPYAGVTFMIAMAGVFPARN